MSVVHIENPEESVRDKFIRKSKEEPWIPIGCLLTCTALFMAGKNTGKDSQAVNRWFRLRILFQGLTIAAIVAGSYQMQQVKAAREDTKEQDREKEKREFEERMRAAVEVDALERAAAKPKDDRTVFEKWGLGRGSLKAREAALKSANAPPPPAAVDPPPAASVAPTSTTSPSTSSAATTSVGSWFSWFGSSSPKTPSDSEKKQ